MTASRPVHMALPIGIDGTLRAPRRVAAHLQRARDLLARQGAWIQESYACSRTGRTVDSQSLGAYRFCCSGALYATARPGDHAVLARVLLFRVLGSDIEVWNDTPGRRLDEVLDAFDSAIALGLAAADHLGEAAA